MHLLEHGSPVENSPFESVRECLAFQPAGPAWLAAKMPCGPVKAPLGGGPGQGCVLCIRLHLQIDQEPQRSLSLQQKA